MVTAIEIIVLRMEIVHEIWLVKTEFFCQLVFEFFM